MEGNSFSFAAIRGIQAGTAYYVVMIPLRLVTRLFVFDEEELPADLRAQRVLSRARIPQIASYLSDNWEEYILSSLCASVDGDLEFTPAADKATLRNVGSLKIPMDARILLNDGQHRRAAIVEALKTRPSLENETISVVIFADRGLKRSQQMFADLNKNAVRPSGSLNVLFDHRNPLARLTGHVLEAVPFFHRYVDLEKTSLSNRATKLYTLSSLNQANEWLAGVDADRFDADTDELVAAYWKRVVEVMEDWVRLAAGARSTAELRQETVHAHGVMLQAFGVLGSHLLVEREATWSKDLEQIASLNWSRRNSDLWEGRVMFGGRMNGQRRSVQLGANVLCRTVGLTLDDTARAAEENFESELSKTSELVEAS